MQSRKQRNNFRVELNLNFRSQARSCLASLGGGRHHSALGRGILQAFQLQRFPSTLLVTSFILHAASLSLEIACTLTVEVLASTNTTQEACQIKTFSTCPSVSDNGATAQEHAYHVAIRDRNRDLYRLNRVSFLGPTAFLHREQQKKGIDAYSSAVRVLASPHGNGVYGLECKGYRELLAIYACLHVPLCTGWGSTDMLEAVFEMTTFPIRLGLRLSLSGTPEQSVLNGVGWDVYIRNITVTTRLWITS